MKPERTLRPGHRGYPARLTSVYRPPVLHVMGPFGRWDLPTVAIVGSRAATVRACRMTEELAAELAGAGVVIASGLARGIDGAAHRGALAARGKTVAVLGTGLDIVYPLEHAALRDDIAETGALVTELPAGTPPKPFHFPRRNRILAGLSDVVVVVEAERTSGALLTARWALDTGREVMAVPRSPWDPGSSGVNGLLMEGAAPVLGSGDVLTALTRLTGVTFPTPVCSNSAPRKEDADPGLEGRVLSVLDARGPQDAESLREVLGGVPLDQLLGLLGRLEVLGRIRRGRQGYEAVRTSVTALAR